MKFVAVIFFSSLVAAYAAPRIIGGHDAPNRKYSYMVSLRKSWSDIHFCGGSILNKRWILTAGECIEDRQDNDLIVVAGTNLLEGGQGQVYYSEYLVAHTRKNNSAFTNDIGLIRVSKDIEFNDKVQPIKLPTEDFNEVGHPVTMSGWGGYSGWTTTPNKLQEITLKLADQDQCRQALASHDFEIDEDHICTLAQREEGICFNDAGGPLVVDGVQIGIASYVIPCAVGVPDVYTRVYTFLDWIAAEQAKF